MKVSNKNEINRVMNYTCGLFIVNGYGRVDNNVNADVRGKKASIRGNFYYDF